jgi:hypothetical protein
MTTLPLQLKRKTHTPREQYGQVVDIPIGHAFSIVLLPFDTAPRSHRVSPISKLPDAPGSRLCPPSLGSWLCGATKKHDGFVVNNHKPADSV